MVKWVYLSVLTLNVCACACVCVSVAFTSNITVSIFIKLLHSKYQLHVTMQISHIISTDWFWFWSLRCNLLVSVLHLYVSVRGRVVLLCNEFMPSLKASFHSSQLKHSNLIWHNSLMLLHRIAIWNYYNSIVNQSIHEIVIKGWKCKFSSKGRMICMYSVFRGFTIETRYFVLLKLFYDRVAMNELNRGSEN